MLLIRGKSYFYKKNMYVLHLQTILSFYSLNFYILTYMTGNRSEDQIDN